MTMRYIKDEFWTDPYTENLDPSEKLLFIYLLTNPLCNIAGIYEARISRIAFETGFDKEMIEKILNRFVKDKKILRVDDWIIVINFVKNQANNPSVLLGVQRILDSLPPKVIQALTASPQPVPYYTILNLTIPNLITGNTFKENELEVKNKTKKDYTNAFRKAKGKPPLTPRKSSDKQKAILESFKGIEYFKKKGYEDHGMQFLEVKNEKRNLIVRKLIIEAQKVVENLNLLIDWWFSGNGEWASYEPEQCFSTKTIEKFKNSTKTKQSKDYIYIK